MKGVIFSIFSKLVEEKFDLETWDRMLGAINPASGGAYTSADTYADEEFYSLITELSRETGNSKEDVVLECGKYMLGQMAILYPSFFKNKNLKQFLLGIDGIIHVEVKKLLPDADPPKFYYEDHGPGRLVMIYHSDRKLCRFAEGLIDGASQHFGTPIERVQSKCYARGDEHCRFEIEFKGR